MIGYLKLWQLFVYVVFPSSVAGVVIGVIKGKRERVAALKKIKVPVPIAKPANQDEANNVVVLDSSPDKILFPYV